MIIFKNALGPCIIKSHKKTENVEYVSEISHNDEKGSL